MANVGRATPQFHCKISSLDELSFLSSLLRVSLTCPVGSSDNLDWLATCATIRRLSWAEEGGPRLNEVVDAQVLNAKSVPLLLVELGLVCKCAGQHVVRDLMALTRFAGHNPSQA